MRKLYIIVLLLIMGIKPVYANGDFYTAEVTSRCIYMNNVLFGDNDNSGKVFPISYNNTTYLPLKTISRLFGLSTTFTNNELHMFTNHLRVNVINQDTPLPLIKEITITEAKLNNIFLNEQNVNFIDDRGNHIMIIYYNDTLWLPIRYIANLLNVSIVYDAKDDSIYIYTSDVTMPDLM